jgi:hypothetical protein
VLRESGSAPAVLGVAPSQFYGHCAGNHLSGSLLVYFQLVDATFQGRNLGAIGADRLLERFRVRLQLFASDTLDFFL